MWRNSGVATISARHLDQLEWVRAYARERFGVQISMENPEIIQTWWGFGPAQLRVRLVWRTIDKRRGELIGDWLQITLRGHPFSYRL